MRTSAVLFTGVCLVSVSLASVSAAPGSGAPSCVVVPLSKAAFLQRSTLAAWVPPAAPPQSLGLLESSVLPSTVGTCSTQNAGNFCSVDASTPAPSVCSVNCDSNDQCSAFYAESGDFGCSVAGGSARGCSVIALQPEAGSGGFCSAQFFPTTFTGGDRIWCSVEAPGSKTFCSAMNGSAVNGNNNFCSVLADEAQGIGQKLWCSALLGGNTNRNYCSTLYVAGPTAKTCSVNVTIPGLDSQCSVRNGQNAFCTTLKNAPAGSCSVVVGNGHCSVIGGAGPNPNGLCKG